MSTALGRRTDDARPRRGSRRASRRVAALSGIAAVLLAWLVLGSTGVIDPSSIAGLPQTARALAGELGKADFWSAIGDTVLGWAMGLVLGTVAGLLLGAAIGLNRRVYQSTAVVIEFLKTVPIIAILPLAILVLGTTLQMKVLLVAFGVMWPLTVQTMYGVRSVDPVVRDTAMALRMGPLHRFRAVVLPSAAPYIATGMRVAAAGALILTIVTELIAGGSGIGVEITTAASSGARAIPVMYARIVAAGVLGVLVAVAFTAVERRLLRWHEAYRPVQS
jgi:ABC-type nitrate/sulfonate/bicarbonate transport system permease component